MVANETLFELSEVEASDRDALLHVRVAAFANDPLWRHLNVKESYNDQSMFFEKFMKMQFLAEDKVTFKLTEITTGKLVAWASLKYPDGLRPLDITVGKQVEAKDRDLKEPEFPTGFNFKVWAEVLKGRTVPEPGYDPSIHFHRMGTMVLPEYQRMGLGKWLTRHCNKIADQHKGSTYVKAKPGAAKMLKTMGFEVLEILDPHLERLGWSKEDAEDQTTTILCRKPKDERDAVGPVVLL